MLFGEWAVNHDLPFSKLSDCGDSLWFFIKFFHLEIPTVRLCSLGNSIAHY
jgi:hypothetical protein